MEENVCCPEFHPEPWEKATHEWKDKPFIKDSIRQFLHMPLPGQMNKVVTRMWENAQQCGVTSTNMNDFLLLAYDPTPWKSELYMSVQAEHPDLNNLVRLSGTFLSKTYDGSYNKVPVYLEDMKAWLKEQGKEGKKFYFYYTTCPACARKYGHNWIVAFAEV